MLSEKEKNEIGDGASKILEKFGKALEDVKFSNREAKIKKGGIIESYRKEREGEVCDEDFRKKMFGNAPKVKGDCIVAEKKKW